MLTNSYPECKSRLLPLSSPTLDSFLPILRHFEPFRYLPQRTIFSMLPSSLMSDYEVTLVNDNMQEFYVKFKGPVESEYSSSIAVNLHRSSIGTLLSELGERWERERRKLSRVQGAMRLWAINRYRHKGKVV